MFSKTLRVIETMINFVHSILIEIWTYFHRFRSDSCLNKFLFSLSLAVLANIQSTPEHFVSPAAEILLAFNVCAVLVENLNKYFPVEILFSLFFFSQENKYFFWHLLTSPSIHWLAFNGSQRRKRKLWTLWAWTKEKMVIVIEWMNNSRMFFRSLND